MNEKGITKSRKPEEIFTNCFMVAAYANPEAINATGMFIANTYGVKNIMRMTFFGTKGVADMDGTNGQYFYDEIYEVLSKTIQSVEGENKSQPVMLCQLVTDRELTHDDLLAIQVNVKDSPLTIINRWHKKHRYTWENGEMSNPFTSDYKDAGYLSIFNGEISEDKRASEHMAEFVQEYIIDMIDAYPKRGEKSKRHLAKLLDISAEDTVREKNIFTNYIIAEGTDTDAIAESGAYITNTYGLNNILRMTFFNIDADGMDNTCGEYAYDETYTLLCETVRGKNTPAMLCQLVTDKELTKDDLLAIQENTTGSAFEITNRWHFKCAIKWADCQLNLLRPYYQAAGYTTILNGAVSKNKKFYANISDFVQENGIDILTSCPECGERTTAAEVHFNGVCPDCSTEFKAKIKESFGRALKNLEI